MDVTRQPGWPAGTNGGATTVQTATIRQPNSQRAGLTAGQGLENGGNSRRDGANDHISELMGDPDSLVGQALGWLVSQFSWEVSLAELRAGHERRCGIDSA